MLAEADKLRWLGIDMRPRRRRRAAVVLTYAAYTAVVWVHTGGMYGALLALWVASLLLPEATERYQTWRRKRETPPPPKLREVIAIPEVVATPAVAVRPGADPDRLAKMSRSFKRMSIWMNILSVEFLVIGVWVAWGYVRAGGGPWVAAWAFLLLVSDSALARNKLVDTGYRGWMARAIRKPETLSGWRRRSLARVGFGIGLEGFTWCEYRMSFKRLTETQKAEVEELHQAYPQGKWMRPRKTPLFDDERLLQEENELRARVQKVMTWLLVAVAVVLTFPLADHATIGSAGALAGIWTLAGVAATLRQAIPLWMEDDPQEMVGELAIVGEARA
jgi:hypothetical protein